MAKKYDLTNISPRKITIRFGLRSIVFGKTAYALHESEITDGVKKLIKEGHLRMTESKGKPRNVLFRAPDPPHPPTPKPIILQAAKDLINPEPIVPVPHGTDVDDLKQFPWIEPQTEPETEISQIVESEVSEPELMSEPEELVEVEDSGIDEFIEEEKVPEEFQLVSLGLPEENIEEPKPDEQSNKKTRKKRKSTRRKKKSE